MFQISSLDIKGYLSYDTDKILMKEKNENDKKQCLLLKGRHNLMLSLLTTCHWQRLSAATVSFHLNVHFTWSKCIVFVNVYSHQQSERGFDLKRLFCMNRKGTSYRKSKQCTVLRFPLVHNIIIKMFWVLFLQCINLV